jgi:glycosyltransferase involved in cell wall biosynthesis/GR25 family glycosyltransferase involved in LPS biosynthesis
MKSRINSRIRLHIPGIPYTITRAEYSHDAFTAKVMRFAPMMQSLGFEVFHYGVETSTSGASESIDLLSVNDWKELRLQTIEKLEKVDRSKALEIHDDPTFLINNLSNWDTPLCNEFINRFKIELKKRYRNKATDVVCIPLGRTYSLAITKDMAVLEIGIGYNNSFCDFRVFESYAWMSSVLASEKRQPEHYWFVIPHAFDTSEFKVNLKPKKRVGFLGRLIELKGMGIFRDIARAFPDIEFVMCGQGDPKKFLNPDIPNLVYKNPIHGEQRSEFLGECAAFLHPCLYLEPFGCGPVEAQLCGTPVICSDWGGMAETVEQFKTGLRCHTIADYIFGIQLALEGKFDREYIRNRAVEKYDMYKLAYNYEYAIKAVLSISNNQGGWYSKTSYLPSLYDYSMTNNICSVSDEQINVDMIYYINLKRREDRDSHMLEQFIRAKIPENKITRFCALDGTLYPFTKQEEDFFKSCTFKSTPSYKKIMGNQLSHFYIFKDMLEKKYEKILILQDDAIFTRDFIRHFNLVSNNLPKESEIVNLGLHKAAYFSHFEAYDLTKESDSDHVEQKKINDYVCSWKKNLQPCSLAYILTKKGAENLVEYFTRFGFILETDHNLNNYLKNKDIFWGSRKILVTGNPSLGTDIFDTKKWWS